MKSLRAIIMSTTLCLPLAAQADTTILFNNFLPPPDVTNRNVVQPWLESIQTATEGRVTIEQPAASLAPPPELLNTVQQGIADAGFIMVGFLEQSNPLLQLSLLPGINGNAEDSSIALWRTYQEMFAGKDDLGDVKLLGLVAVTPGHIYNMGDAPIDSIDDLKNLKMWALPGVSASAISALGAVVTPGPAVRMYEVISGGVVDSFCCINYPALEGFNVTQFMKSATEMPGGVFSPTFAFFVRNDVWDTIPPEDQAAIMNVSGEAMGHLAAGIDKEYGEARQRYIDQGGQVIAASDELVADMQEAWAPIRANWIANADAAGVDGTAAIDFYAAQIKELSGE